MDLNNDGTITEEEMRKYNEMYAAMSSASRQPRGTSAHVLRESDIYGLMLDRPASRQMQRSAAKWSRGKGSCEIVKYADAYASMARCSPFAKSASSR